MPEPREPNRKLSKEERRQQDREITRAAAQRQAKKMITDRRNRRLVLAGIGLGVTAVTFGGGFLINNQMQAPEMPKGDDLFPQKLRLQKGPEIAYLTNKTGNQVSETAPIRSSVDRNYLNELLSQLQEETNDSSGRSNKVINNLSLILTTQRDGSSGLTNALMLDNSGIFLTCGHTFMIPKLEADSTPEAVKFHFESRGLAAKVVHPALMRRFRILQYVADSEKDIAVFYAPTGYRRKRTEGIQIRTEELKEGEDLWQTALFIKDNTLGLQIMSGSVVSGEKNTEINSEPPFTGRVGVIDMIPFGGSSGSPIIDTAGKVVGVESGLFIKPGIDMTKDFNRQDYAGSAISPLRSLQELVRNSNFVNLPV